MAPSLRKQHLELLLRNKGLGSALPAVLPRQQEVLSTGIATLNALLLGGLPRGQISEITGPLSSGKTSLLCSLLSSATHQREAVAYVDSNALDPLSASRNGVDLTKLLWVRCQEANQIVKATDILCHAGNFGVIVMDLQGFHLAKRRSKYQSAVTSPRSTVIGHQSPVSRQWSVVSSQPESHRSSAKNWPDLSDLWFRLQRAVEGTRTVLLVLADRPVARHTARISVRLRRQGLHWRGKQSLWKLLQGFSLEAQLARGPMESLNKKGVVNVEFRMSNVELTMTSNS